ncbi:MAG: Holliday junction branch migration protein RuvA [Acidobacteriota bacterium]|nr:MAG: Holliday junction branch migration protein RuvA [Acidobacteriota bacterium]
MIARITGKLIHKLPNAIIVDVNGVGYELTVPLSTFYVLGEVGTVVGLNVHTHVREDALSLFGFSTDQEKRLFLMLIGVSGIGPRLAVTILSGLGTEELIQAIRLGDLPRLVAIPGVGKKTAERMVVELKDKVSSLAIAEATPQTTAGLARSGAAMIDDVVSALVNLGYLKAASEKAVGSIVRDNPDADFTTTLKLSLRILSK